MFDRRSAYANACELTMRMIVLFPGALGDLCLLAPALAAVAASGTRVELSVQRSLAPVAAILLPTCVLGPPIDGAAMAALFAAAVSPALREWLQRADRLHAWLARGDADGRLSARFRDLGLTAHLHAVPRGDGERHVGEEYAAALDLAEPPAPLRLTPPAVSIGWPGCGTGAVRVLLHPGAGARVKRWAAEGFRGVGDAWVEAGGEAAILLGPAEEDDAESWRSAGYEPLTGVGIAAVATLMTSASAWVGNDSGMSHLAGALGMRGVVIFGPTRPRRWRPLGGRLTAIEIDGRSVAAVTQEVLAILGTPGTPP